MSNMEIVRMWCNEDSHDKIYGAYYNVDERTILGVWGRRGNGLSSQVKKNKSYSEFLKLINSKKTKGYNQITDDTRDEIEIRLSLDEVANNVVGFGGVLKDSVEEISDVDLTFSALKGGDIVTCIDVSGLENFEKGVTYLFKQKVNDDIILVENMLGEDEKVLGERFQVGELETV